MPQHPSICSATHNLHTATASIINVWWESFTSLYTNAYHTQHHWGLADCSTAPIFSLEKRYIPIHEPPGAQPPGAQRLVERSQLLHPQEMKNITSTIFHHMLAPARLVEDIEEPPVRILRYKTSR
jgi:hypothetical protein